MGNSGAGGQKPYVFADAETPAKIHAQSSQRLNSRVVVIGQVATGGTVIIPPFGPDKHGTVVIEAKTFKLSEHSHGLQHRKNRNERLFTAFNAVDFNICDSDGKKIAVTGIAPENWMCGLEASHVAMNVARSTPNAESFWKDFGADSWAGLAQTENDIANTRGSVLAGGGLRPHDYLAKVKFSSIKVGDVVVVTGTLTNGKDGLCIKGGDGAAISNLSSDIKRYSSSFKPPISAGIGSSTQLGMSKALGGSTSPSDVFDFRQIDADHDGFISLEELTAVFKKLPQHSLSAEDIRKLFEAIDADKSGGVSLGEFVDFLTEGENFFEKADGFLANQGGQAEQ